LVVGAAREFIRLRRLNRDPREALRPRDHGAPGGRRRRSKTRRH
jgi:hypothetical protein